MDGVDCDRCEELLRRYSEETVQLATVGQRLVVAVRKRPIDAFEDVSYEWEYRQVACSAARKRFLLHFKLHVAGYNGGHIGGGPFRCVASRQNLEIAGLQLENDCAGYTISVEDTPELDLRLNELGPMRLPFWQRESITSISHPLLLRLLGVTPPTLVALAFFLFNALSTVREQENQAVTALDTI